MKQFKTILGFELKAYFKNKSFVGITLFLVLAIAVLMFFPRISEAFKAKNESGTESGADGGIKDRILLSAEGTEQADKVFQAFAAAFPEYELLESGEDEEALSRRVMEGEAVCAFHVRSLQEYTYIVDHISMYEDRTGRADQALELLYKSEALGLSGLSAQEAEAILSATAQHETINLGKDQTKNFFYTYIMIFALYMVIMLYGQMVATNVATEKSSRAMELLVTSAEPASMMFGKVLSSGLAGLIQILAVFGSALLFHSLNRDYWAGNEIINSVFGMPLELFIYMLVFFVLGFLVYAFLYGAVGSTVSKLEDINTAVMPLTMLFIAAFFVVIFSMSSGNVDTMLMKVCSYIPFTSPMAMFTRIAMGSVAFYEIAISILILIGSVLGIGLLSAKIYRLGVLLYGKPPKLSTLIKAALTKSGG